MDFYKLKLDMFQTYQGLQLPNDIVPPLEPSDEPDVYFAFVSSFEELNRITNQLLNKPFKQENRVFYIYKKGHKDFHRDHIMMYGKRSPFLKRKAPMLSSLNKDYSCVTFQLIK